MNWRRLLGDMLLGLSIGLLAYEALTGAYTWRQQAGLRDQLDRSAAAASRPASAAADPAWDFGGWESEDAAFWRSLSDGDVFARITAPAARIDAVVVKGVGRDVLTKGPGWAPYSDLPGPTGNVGISGHRTTYLAPFRKLDALSSGDTIDVYSPYRRYRYEVQRSFAVKPDEVEVMETTSTPMLTLTACHPPYSARLRLVVQARLVEVRRLRGGR